MAQPLHIGSLPMPGADPVKINRSPARRKRWRRVAQAQDVLLKESKAITETLVRAAKAGDVKTGRWLLEHTATVDDTGAELRPIAPGIDSLGGNARPDPSSDAPRILIGIGLGGDFARLAGSSGMNNQTVIGSGAHFPGTAALPGAGAPARLNAQQTATPANLSQPVSPRHDTSENTPIFNADPVLDSQEDE